MKDNKINDLKEVKEICKISPFRCYCTTLGELPTTYFETMSYYETLIWLIDYLKNTILPKLNENLEATKELQDKFKELVDWINNYFNDLDLEPIVREVLDKMAEDGTLARIINEELFGTINNNITEINLKLKEIENILKSYTADFTKVNEEIEKLKLKNTEQDTNITNNTNNINDLKAKVNDNTKNINQLNTFKNNMTDNDTKLDRDYSNFITLYHGIGMSHSTQDNIPKDHTSGLLITYDMLLDDVNYKEYSANLINQISSMRIGTNLNIINFYLCQRKKENEEYVYYNRADINSFKYNDYYKNIVSDFYIEYLDNGIVLHIIDKGNQIADDVEIYFQIVYSSKYYLFHKKQS